ncbi:MAG TPA: class I adenylate-forming enzyme family protein [Xanthobacteraceae bacterium]|nr:class I adenylate-forming enzyme family protein [Xanthobacteraceae bacterium]
MILGQSSPQHAAMLAKAGRSTLDDIFRRAVARRADAIALADPANAAAVTGSAPRRLTYAQADRMITAVAARLRHLGLQTDQVVALQMANTVDAVVTLLGILRAGLIAMPLPLLWREADCVAALNRIGARAFIVSGHIGAVDHCALAMNAAAQVFQIRQVGGFGSPLADGVIAFDDLYAEAAPAAPPAITRPVNPAAHAAVITWDVAPEGLVPVARNHFELLAAGAAITLESRIEPHAVVLASLALPSLAGLALGLVPWLLVGGTLALHHPFDIAAFLTQCQAEQPAIVIVPAPLALRLGEADALSRRDGLKTLVAAWRAPERMAASPNWSDAVIGLVDVPVFGETALFAARRGVNGRPAALALGPVTAPRGAPGALQVIEIARTPAGSLAVRGPMVPKFPLPFELDAAARPAFAVGVDGFADTGYPCTVDPVSHALAINGAPAGIVGVGGYRFGARALAEIVASAEPGSRIAARPDALAGQRLAGTAADRARVHGELAQRGVNPLVLTAFGP